MYLSRRPSGSSCPFCSVQAEPQNGIQRSKAVVIERRSAVVVRSESLLRSGTARRMDSRSFRPPPDAHESTNEAPPCAFVNAMMRSHIS